MTHRNGIILSRLVGHLSGRGNVLHPRRQWALSVVLAAMLVALGLSALPRDVTATANAILLRDPAGGTFGAPVFVLREGGLAVRFGNAVTTQGGAVRVGLYDSLDPLLVHATEPVSLPADPRLLWLLAAPEERLSVRGALVDLARALPQTALHIIQSPEFIGLYRDRLVQRLRSDLERAWRATLDSNAWQDLMRGYEPILRDAVARELRPIIENRFRGVPMQMLRVNALQLVDVFTDRSWNMGPVEEALQAALQEARERTVPERTVTRLLEAPPTGDFIRAFLETMTRELGGDTALRELIAEMVFDERFRPYLSNLMTQAMGLARVAPRLLISLHGSTDLNPVASLVIRTLVSGRNDRVVVFMSPAQRDGLMTLDPEAVRPLTYAVAG